MGRIRELNRRIREVFCQIREGLTWLGLSPTEKRILHRTNRDIDQLYREVPVGNVGGDPQLRRDRPGHFEALRLLEQAIARDPRYGLALA